MIFPRRREPLATRQSISLISATRSVLQSPFRVDERSRQFTALRLGKIFSCNEWQLSHRAHTCIQSIDYNNFCIEIHEQIRDRHKIDKLSLSFKIFEDRIDWSLKIIAGCNCAKYIIMQKLMNHENNSSHSRKRKRNRIISN